MFQIEMLPAYEGDALWIEYGPDGHPPYRLLIDCGRKGTYREVKRRLQAAEDAGDPLAFELFVMTHVDADHIAGAVPLLGDARFQRAEVRELWFNGWSHLHGKQVLPDDALGAQQGEYFAALLQEHRYPWNTSFAGRPIVVHADGPLPTHRLRGGMRLTLLAPTWPMLTAMRDEWRSQLLERDPHDRIDPGDAERALEVLAEQPSMQPDALGTDWLPDWDPDNFQDYADETFDEDTRPPNGSSIAFLAEYEDKAVLFTGDAYPSVLGSSLARLKKERDITGQLGLDAVKLPHHGSRSNISKKLIDSVRCSRWLFSTNGSTHHHPHPEAVARVIDAAPAPTLYFNFRSDESEVWDDDDLRNDHDYQTEYPEDDAGGLVVRL